MIGVMFQIIDDVLNLEINDLSTNKGFVGEDIHEGKISWIVIDAFENLEEKDVKR